MAIICPKCKSIAYFDPYFKAYVCTRVDCDYFDRINEIDPGDEQDKTNWDKLTELSADEFAEEFWNILEKSKWNIDSRVWLKEWLNMPYKEEFF